MKSPKELYEMSLDILILVGELECHLYDYAEIMDNPDVKGAMYHLSVAESQLCDVVDHIQDLAIN